LPSNENNLRDELRCDTVGHLGTSEGGYHMKPTWVVGEMRFIAACMVRRKRKPYVFSRGINQIILSVLR